MYRAIWDDIVLAESEHTVRVEGNHYFPPEALNSEYFTTSPTTSQCPWKGSASYYSITVNGKINRDAAWYYPRPAPAAENIRGHVAFWKGVRVIEIRDTDGSPETRPTQDAQVIPSISSSTMRVFGPETDVSVLMGLPPLKLPR